MLIVARRVAWSGVTFASSELVLQQTVRIREDELALRYRRGSWQLATHRIPPGTLMEKGSAPLPPESERSTSRAAGTGRLDACCL